MTTGATGQLGLALPVQGELSGTWGDTVNNGITQYTNIAIAATLTLTNDGAVTLANTTGDATASNIVSSLTGAGTVTAQFAIVRVTGTLTTAKVVTAPSYSKTYTVVNAATGGIVTFKASGQTGVSIAVGESAFVYYNGTDYVKVSSTVATGVTSFTAGTTGFTPNTATTGAVTLAGTLATTNGGTGLTSFTSGGVVYASSSSALATGSALNFDGFGTLAISNNNSGGTNNFSVANTNANGYAALTIKNTGASGKTYEAGVGGNSTAGNYQNNFYIRDTTGNPTFALNLNNIIFIPGGSTEVARFTSTGLGIGTSSPLAALDVRNTSPNVLINGKDVGEPAIYFGRYQYAALSSSGAKIGYVYGSGDSLQEYGSLTFSTATSAFGAITERARITPTGGFVVGTTTDPGNGIIADINGNVRKVPQSGSSKTSSYTLATTDIGEYILLGASGAIVIPDATFSAGDVITIFNNTASTATITCSITTAYIAGTFTDKATMTLAAAGVATVLFITSTLCVVSGNVT
jgi:hypothetical protein